MYSAYDHHNPSFFRMLRNLLYPFTCSQTSLQSKHHDWRPDGADVSIVNASSNIHKWQCVHCLTFSWPTSGRVLHSPGSLDGLPAIICVSEIKARRVSPAKSRHACGVCIGIDFGPDGKPPLLAGGD